MYLLNKMICLIMIASFFSSCSTTKKLWENVDYVQVSGDSITENELKQKGIKYYKDDKQNAYYVEKTELDKFRDYSLRIFATPFTVAVDAAGDAVVSIIVVGMILCKLDQSTDYYIECDPGWVCHRQKKTEEQKRGGFFCPPAKKNEALPNK